MVKDLSVIELVTLGVNPDVIDRLREQNYIETVSVENRDQQQALLVHSPRGSEAVSDIMELLNGTRVTRVTVREPTLEDAYVRLVGGNV